ncbi:hypothetical protein JTB14_035862 [Gonioctena quinquepunctata]|nr:hypothetical protein JTB14_035862 [Gonioctena quinquepunctata]
MSLVIDENNITNKDLFNMMRNVLSTNETIKKQIDEMKIELRNIKQELSSQIEEPKEENTFLKGEVEKLKAWVSTTRQHNLEAKIEKNKLLVEGVEKKQKPIEDRKILKLGLLQEE